MLVALCRSRRPSMANDVSDRDAIPSFSAEDEDQTALWSRVAVACQRFLARGQLRIALAVGVPCAIIGVDVLFIVSAEHQGHRANLASPVMVSAKPPAPEAHELVPRVSTTRIAVAAEPSAESFFDFDDEPVVSEPSPP